MERDEYEEWLNSNNQQQEAARKNRKNSGEGGEDDENLSTSAKVWRIIGFVCGGIVAALMLTFGDMLCMGYQIYYVLTDSMMPSIKSGETVMVNTNIDRYNLKVGDIITFGKEGATPITHRIIEVIDEDGDGKTDYYLQGEDYKYRIDVLGQEFPNINEEGFHLNAVSPENIRGTVVTIGDKPLKLYVIGFFASIIYQTSNSIKPLPYYILESLSFTSSRVIAVPSEVSDPSEICSLSLVTSLYFRSK